MKKIVAIAMVISAISLGCKAHELIHQDVTIDIDNQSSEEVTVRDQDNNEVTVSAGETQEGNFQLHQPEHRLLRAFHFNDYSTELEVSGKTGTKTIQIKGSSGRTLTIKPGLKCNLSGKGGQKHEEEGERSNKKNKKERHEKEEEEGEEEEDQD